MRNKKLYFNFKNSQKGVVLLITFFIMTIILAIVLSVSIILYSRIKSIRNIGSSVIGFYAADSGVEKALYYDTQVVPGAARGLCNICTPGVCPSCEDCALSPGVPDGCDPSACTDCRVSFTSSIGSNHYEVEANVLQQCALSEGTLKSYGFYKNEVSRAVQLDIGRTADNSFGLTITNAQAVFTPQGPSGGKLNIEADIILSEGIILDGLPKIYIRDGNGNLVVDGLEMNPNVLPHYKRIWNNAQQGEEYSISIRVLTTGGGCASIDNVAISYEE